MAKVIIEHAFAMLMALHRNRKNFCNFIALIACALTMSGCSRHIANLSRLSASNLDFEHIEYEIDKSHRVTGTDGAFVFVAIPFGLPDATTAVKNAERENSRLAGLANVSVNCKWFWLGLGYNQIEVVGYPILRKGEKR